MKVATFVAIGVAQICYAVACTGVIFYLDSKLAYLEGSLGLNLNFFFGLG